MKILLLPLLLLFTGCLAPHKVVHELKDDPASFTLRVNTIYGTLQLTRTAPLIHSSPHAITPEGGITVTK